METNKQTILIIEDDAGLLELTCERIESCGYQIVPIQSAEKAVDWLKVNTSFLMIVDYGLPDMNGKEFIVELKTKEILVPPFIVCTGQGDERIAVDMMKLGARDYIIKDSMFLEMLPLVVSWVAKVVENENKLKLTERALIESAQFNKQIITSVKEGIIVYNMNLIYQVWNPFMENISGLPASEVIGKFPTDIFPFLKDSGYIENLRKTILEKNISEIVLQLNFPITGKSGWFSYLIAPMVNTVGEVIGAISTVRDITERLQAEELLKSSEEQYRTLFENAPIGIGVSDLTGKLIAFNDAMLKPGGYSRDDMMRIGNVVNLYYNSSDRETIISILNKNGFVNQHPIKFKRKDGSPYDTLLTLSFIHFKDQIRIQALLEDITERLATEKASKQMEDALLRINKAVESSGEAIGMSDSQGRHFYQNKAFTEMFEYTAEELDVAGGSLVVYANKEVGHMVFDTIIGGGLWNGEVEMLSKSGRIFPVLLRADAIKDEEGVMVGLVGIHKDMTERKHAEEEIKLKNEQLLKLNAEKDKFFSIIAHDLRGPFSGFLGLTQILAEGLHSLTIDQIQVFSVEMNNSASKLYHLLENLLHWSRMQQGLVPFVPKEMELSSIVNVCIDIVLESAKNKGIEITSDIPNKTEVFADENMLQTIIRNLVSNAVKFTPKGGFIKISAKATGDKDIEISINDTGIGMDQTLVDNLFRLDVQTSRKGTEGEPSTGLGLLLCLEFIEKQGGKIRVESTEGVGSTFYFTVPSKGLIK
jgi:PAS domain S-box-containing protein